MQMQVNEQQIKAMIQQLENKKAGLVRIAENPYYVKYLEIEDLIVKGKMVKQIIAGEQQFIKRSEIQIGRMIEALKKQQQEEQQQQYAPTPSYNDADLLGEEFGEPEPPQPQMQQQRRQPMPPQPQQRQQTMEEKAGEMFETKDEELGIDEDVKFEGLPEFEDDVDNVEPKRNK